MSNQNINRLKFTWKLEEGVNMLLSLIELKNEENKIETLVVSGNCNFIPIEYVKIEIVFFKGWPS